MSSFLSESEIVKLMGMPKIHSKNPIKDQLILELLYSSGMRILELVTIKMENIRIEEGLILVMGKGNIERQVILGSFAKDALKTYLKKLYFDKISPFISEINNNIIIGSVFKNIGDIKKIKEMILSFKFNLI